MDRCSQIYVNNSCSSAENDNKDQNSFSSDTTYCPFYENSRENSRKISKNRKRVKSLSASKILDNIHNEVLHHLEGTKLLGDHEVTRYMKEISGMKLRARQKSTAQKIQVSLLKIHKCLEYFQNNLVHSGQYRNIISDPIEHCGVTQDMQMLESGNKKELKSILIPCANSSETNSFVSDMLSNKNFLTGSSSQFTKTSVKYVNEEVLKNGETNISSGVGDIKIFDEQNSMDLFLSQENKYMEISKKTNIFHEGTDGVEVSPSVASGDPQTLSKKSSSSQTRKNIFNQSSFQFPDSDMMKGDVQSSHSSRDTKVSLRSDTSSFDDTMFKIPVFKYRGKRENKGTAHPNTLALKSAIKDNSQHNPKQEIQNTLTDNTVINKSYFIEKSEFPQNELKAYSEPHMRPRDCHENSFSWYTNTTLSDIEFQSTESTNASVMEDSKKIDSSTYETSHEETALTNEIQSTQTLMKFLPESQTNKISQKYSDSEDELHMMATKIKNLNDKYFQKVNFLSDIIPESIYTQSEKTQANYDTVRTAGNSFVEIYNKKIQKITSEVSNKTWEEINDELEYASKLNQNTLGVLSDMFEKVSIDERKVIENIHTKKLEGSASSFCEFDEEDARELDMKSLRLSNEVRLKQLSAHFKRKLLEEENRSVVNSCGDFAEEYTSLIDWRTLVNQ